MIKSIKFGRNIFLGIKNARAQKRLFLTEAYQCKEAWNRRLDSPILRNVKPVDMYFELESKFNNTGKVSAIDIDIFANTVREEFQIDELLDLIHKLRLSVETTNTLTSTHHAVVRFLLEHNRTSDLFEVLNDRLNYGIFPDYFCYNILMDTFIKEKNFALAAKVAALLMLQEDIGHPISNALSLYSCHRYLENPDDWKIPEVETDDSTEEIKVRVRYLRNAYFDDHFDLIDPLHIVGKTLAFQGKNIDNSLGRTCQLRGLILYKKYNTARELIDTWLVKVNEEIIHEEVLDLIKTDNKHIPEDQMSEDLKNLQIQLDNLTSSNLHKENLLERIENEVKLAVEQHEETDIFLQQKSFLEWEKTRKLTLKKHQALLDKELRLQNIEKIKKDLAEKEKILTFFENEEQIELEIERKQEKIKQENERIAKCPIKVKKLQKLVQQEAYVPPSL